MPFQPHKANQPERFTMRFLTFGMLPLAISPAAAQPLPGTAPLPRKGDLAAQMVEGIDRYPMRRLEEAPARRAAKHAWGTLASLIRDIRY